MYSASAADTGGLNGFEPMVGGVILSLSLPPCPLLPLREREREARRLGKYLTMKGFKVMTQAQIMAPLHSTAVR